MMLLLFTAVDGQDIRLDGEIAPEIFNLRKLTELEIFFAVDVGARNPNKGTLAGLIPDTINRSNTIRLIDLGNQKITGPIPDELYDTLSLREIDLDGNLLTGNITSAVKNLQNLVFFSASDNNFDEQNLTPAFGEIDSLKFLSLNDANLVGPVPTSFKDLTQMTAIDLSNNQMTGGIDFTKDYTKIRSLALANNEFSGNLDELWSKTSLQFIVLGDNQFSGTISTDVGNMVNLKSKCSYSYRPMLSDVRSSNSF